jgi:hypothetical protein
LNEAASVSPPLGPRPALDPLHHVNRMGRHDGTARAAATPPRLGDAPADRARGLVELDGRRSLDCRPGITRPPAQHPVCAGIVLPTATCRKLCRVKLLCCKGIAQRAVVLIIPRLALHLPPRCLGCFGPRVARLVESRAGCVRIVAAVPYLLLGRAPTCTGASYVRTIGS